MECGNVPVLALFTAHLWHKYCTTIAQPVNICGTTFAQPVNNCCKIIVQSVIFLHSLWTSVAQVLHIPRISISLQDQSTAIAQLLCKVKKWLCNRCARVVQWLCKACARRWVQNHWGEPLHMHYTTIAQPFPALHTHCLSSTQPLHIKEWTTCRRR